VLIIPAEGLAEMLLIYPALSMLRAALPESRIICMADPGQADIFRNLGVVDDFVDPPKSKGATGILSYRPFVSEIRERMPEAVFYFDFRYDFYRVLLPMLCGAKLRFKLRGEIGYPLFNIEIVPGRESTYLRDLNISLVRFLLPDNSRWETWQLAETEVKIAREIVRFRKPNPNDLLIGVDLSGTKTDEKPPIDIGIRLARSFAALKPCRIALLSDPEPAYKDDDIRRMGSFDWLDIPRKSFRDTLGILSQCDLVICPNSNLFHFAIAMGIPTFALLSAKDDAKWLPTDGVFDLIQEDVWTNTPPAKLAMRLRDFVCAPSRV
jgi:heptosyltransferase-2